MHRRVSFLLLLRQQRLSLVLLLLFLLTIFLPVVRSSYVTEEASSTSSLFCVAGLLKKERLVEKFNLLTPEALLANYRFERSKKKNRLNSTKCSRSLDLYTRAIDRQEPWALKMLDASSTVPSGILEGNIVELGSYDECVRIKGEFADISIRGQHCMYEIGKIRESSIIPYNPTMSICLPRDCNVDDLINMIKVTEVLSNKSLSPVTATCTNEDWKFWDAELVVFASIVGVYISFLIGCTICDLCERWSIKPSGEFKEEIGSITKTLARFSLIKSSESIFTIEPQPGNVPVINGIRFISSLLVILLHEYIFFGLVVNSNVFYIYEWLSSWKSVIPLLTSFSVDTFFTLSGFLMISSFFKQVQKDDFNVWRFYLHRFVRLTAPMIPLIFIAVALLPKLGSGPRWQWTKEMFLTSCYTKWWTLLLHVQNFVQIDNYCLLELWTCSVDMQLYTISLFIVYYFKDRRKIAIKIFVLLIVTSIIITAGIVGVNGYYTTYISRKVSAKFALEAFNKVYFMTYTRSSPFFLGVLLGYLVQNKNLKLKKGLARKCWTLTTIGFLTYPIALKIISDANYKYTLIFEMLCSAFSRPVWSLMICWIIYSTVLGSTGPVTKFLSWKYFLPLGRLSYSIYLVHLAFPIFRTMTTKTSWYFSDLILLHSFLSNLILSITLAFMFCIAFEMPVFVLDDLLFKRKRKICIKIEKLGAKEVKSHIE